jgi:hypothetical protein
MSGTTFQAIHVWIAERKTLLFWNLTMCEARKEKLLAIWPVRGTLSQLYSTRLQIEGLKKETGDWRLEINESPVSNL